MCLASVAIALFILVDPAVSQGSVDVDGGWSPWQVDPSVDCCAFGSYARYRRFCVNPVPEGNGKKCTTSNGTNADTEDAWRTCSCGCWPPCDTNTSFCANDTGTGAYCKCNYPLVVQPGYDYLNVTTCVLPTTTTHGPSTTRPATMAPDLKKTMNMAQYISIIVLLGFLSVSFVLTIFMLGFKPLRIIQMNQEITLAATYALIGFLVETTGNKAICAMVSVLLHYLFLCAMTFFCLEALHTYSLVTYVVPVKGFLSSIANIAVGYGVPLLPLALSLGFLYNTYGTNGRHCWCDLNSSGGAPAWAFLFPVCFGALACTVIAEAQGQGKYEPLPDVDEKAYRSAKISQHTVMVKMPLAVSSYVIGLLAVDMQFMPLYIVFFVLALALGLAVLIAHVSCIPSLAGICPCAGRDRATMNVRVSPAPEPSPMKME